LKLPRWTTPVLQAAGFRLLELWAQTLRYTFDDRAGVVGGAAERPYILAFWHNRLLLLPYIVRRFLPARKPTALISASRDGEVAADLVERFGFETVRGSSSRRGASAVLRLTQIIAEGGDLAITPDGPRGPVYEVSAGTIFLAQKSGAPVLPFHVEFSRAWRMKSWDRFFLPVPFSTVHVFFGQPHVVPETSNEAEFEGERLRLQEVMLALVKQR
jgi:lysophospholipid acyltransferase (LPLAT)-like uncharacterized protein